METAMTSDVRSIFPSLIAQARRTVGAFWARVTRAAQYHRELELLMHADDRMLADIGLSRFDVVSAAQASRGWRGRRDALQAAATRRDEAMAVARSRRAGLPSMAAPALAPALPHAMETSNFR
jgi:uncharacterized protein YjiS (DUF1127 family)